ncbi:MAG: polyprenyl synthetase family protein [Candidatus Thermoplasmatota archaeon]|jgi:geranylgeranyl pyrophosphate synthase|nr:polyprenyl synthetase family protein [Candidatus Thermoplasmatota archaeon]
MTNKKQTLNDFFENTQLDLEKKIETTIQDKKIISILESGKRLRPLLAHLAFKVCTGGKETPYQYQRALEGAVVIELAHTASLVHDDIIDNDKERRGKPALYIKEGIPSAMLLGHKMLAIGLDIALRHGEKIAKLYTDTWNEILNGELKEINFNKKDIQNNGSKEITKSKIFNEYYKIINMKTASLYSSACKAGAIEANANGQILTTLEEYGREIGLAYQLADDLVDLENGEILDSVIVPLLNRLDKDTVDNNSLEINSLKEKLAENSSKIKQFYINEIKKHVNKATGLSKSDTIPNSPYKDMLIEAPKYIINKMLKEINIAI